jgi:hypothetical protein
MAGEYTRCHGDSFGDVRQYNNRGGRCHRNREGVSAWKDRELPADSIDLLFTGEALRDGGDPEVVGREAGSAA